MFSLFRTPLSASAVDQSISANFLAADEVSLVTAGADMLRVFRMRPQVGLAEVDYSDANPPKMRLECLASWKLHGSVQSLQKVRLVNSVRDALLISFLDAKLSLVEYDADKHDLRTISLHIFEDDDTRGGYVHNHFVPFVRVDPDNRCAAMLVYGRKIVILPFRRDMSMDSEEMQIDGVEAGGSGASQQKSSVPILSSYTLDLKSVITTNGVDNIIDLQFLHGYNQPTLLILYEPLKTFSGRIAVRKDTCRLDVITLDVKERISAFIWSKEVLPFDCVRALPVPKPIGGTLVLAVNSLFYLNQGIPPYGVSLNAIGDSTMENVVKQLDGVKLALDCAEAVFITPERAVISLKGGELYVLSLLIDGMRSVRGFHFDRAAASVLTTTLTVLEDRYLFLGSRLGNSLLLQFTEKDIGSVYGSSTGGLLSKATNEPPSKKKRVDATGDWMASDVSDIQEDDLEVYGQEESVSTSRIGSYSFEVCDSLLNIGPCGNVSMGEPAFLSDEFASVAKADPDVELVTTSGHGKNGALCVLQQTVRPQVVTTFELPGCQDIWTVIGDSELDKGHSFLILSRADSTMVLQTGQEINELDKSGFFTQGPTVFTGNLGDNKYIVQVSPRGVRLLNGSEQLQNLALDLPSPIVEASCADPHLLIMTSEGQIVLLTLQAEIGMPQLSVIKANLKSRSKLINICAYKDVSGLFTTDMPGDAQVTTKNRPSSMRPSVSVAPMLSASIEDEDALLYGDAAPAVTVSGPSKNADGSERKRSYWRQHMRKVKGTYWAILLRENGSLEILSLPDFTLKFVVLNFPLGADVLTDATIPTTSASDPKAGINPDLIPTVTEILMVGLGAAGRRPLLLARLDDHEMLAYELFPFYDKSLSSDQLKMRFKKVKHGLVLRERKGKSKRDLLPVSRHSLRPFQDIAGYEGVFVCGPYPHLLLLTARGELRTHPMPIDGSIPCFAPFHNVNCPNGFLYFNRKGELRICVLPTHLSYDAPWPVRKVPLRCTPHFITYHLESKTYAVVTSSSEQTDKVWKFNGDDKELCTEERDDRFPWPNKDTFNVQLFSPVSWEPIPNTKLQLEEWERCTGMKHLFLSSEGLHSGQRGYIVCSTAYCYGEDVTPRGYIRIYDVIEVIPEPGQPLTKNKIKTVYDKEQKGPITAITAVNGYLVATVGQKIYIFQFKNKDLFGVAFIDSQVYIHQLASIKNFILVGDVMKSVDLLQFQKDYRTLAVISRDVKPLEVYACEFVVDNNQLAFMVTDADKNIILYMYQPEARESNGGQRLVRRGDFQVGQHINAIFRIKAKITDPSTGGRLLTGGRNIQCSWFATLDGAFGYILPCAEKTFRRLQMMANVMTQTLPHAAGLNPKAFRTLRQRRRCDLINPCRGIADGDLVFRFSDLSLAEKSEIARKIGTNPTDLMDDLAELDRMAAHF